LGIQPLKIISNFGFCVPGFLFDHNTHHLMSCQEKS
jgi:hypothetical protein